MNLPFFHPTRHPSREDDNAPDRTSPTASLLSDMMHNTRGWSQQDNNGDGGEHAPEQPRQGQTATMRTSQEVGETEPMTALGTQRLLSQDAPLLVAVTDGSMESVELLLPTQATAARQGPCAGQPPTVPRAVDVAERELGARHRPHTPVPLSAQLESPLVWDSAEKDTTRRPSSGAGTSGGGPLHAQPGAALPMTVDGGAANGDASAREAATTEMQPHESEPHRRPLSRPAPLFLPTVSNPLLPSRGDSSSFTKPNALDDDGDGVSHSRLEAKADPSGATAPVTDATPLLGLSTGLAASTAPMPVLHVNARSPHGLHRRSLSSFVTPLLRLRDTAARHLATASAQWPTRAHTDFPLILNDDGGVANAATGDEASMLHVRAVSWQPCTHPETSFAQTPMSALLNADSEQFEAVVAPPAIKVRASSRRFVVHQTHDLARRCVFDMNFVQMQLQDVLEFRWYGDAFRICETDHTYNRLVPGGLRSGVPSHNVLSPPQSLQLPPPPPPLLPPPPPGQMMREASDPGPGLNTFFVQFRTPGNYFFVCTRNKRTMRLQVQVAPRTVYVAKNVMRLLLTVVLPAAIIIVVACVLSFWLQRKDLFLSRKNAVSQEQYDGLKKLQRIITLYLFPWLVTGVLVIFGTIFAAGMWYAYRRWHPARAGAFHRGITTRIRTRMVVCSLVLAGVTVTLLFVAYGLQLDVTSGINMFATQLSNSMLNTLNAFMTATSQVQWLVQEGRKLFPDVPMPQDQVNELLGQVSGLLTQTERWTRFGEDVAQGAFRILPILLFLTLQIGLFVSSLMIGSAVLRFRRIARVVVWILAGSVGVYACMCGVTWALYVGLQKVYDSAVLLKDSPAALSDVWGISNDSIVYQVLASCDLTPINMQPVDDYIIGIVHEINASLSPDEQKAMQETLTMIIDILPVAGELLVNYTDFFQRNLDILENLLNTRPADVDQKLDRDIVPFLRVLLNVVNLLYGLVDCRIFRNIVAQAIPIMRRNVQNYHTALMVIVFILFGLGVVAVFVSAIVSYSLSNPRRYWFEARTGRWFRFRFSFKVHHTVRLKRRREQERDRAWIKRMQTYTDQMPFIERYNSFKLVLYGSSVLMFFDAILLVLFNNLARYIAEERLISALAYLQAIQLIFLLLASVFTRLLWRRLLRGTALLIAFACFVVSLITAVLSFVKFGKCVSQVHFGNIIDGNDPLEEFYYTTCPIVLVGHKLEVAIYATVVMLNSIVVCVSAAYVMWHEQCGMVRVTQMRKPYVGVLAPLARYCHLLRRLFRDQLIFKRVRIAVFTFVVLVFFIIITVVDLTHFNVAHNAGLSSPKADMYMGPITQVYDPNVGCNGDVRFCDRRVNEIIWATTHNSHSSLEDDFVMPNHYYNISHQLAAGVRGYTIDLWYDVINASEGNATGVYLCHSVCLLGRRTFRSVVQAFKTFLDTYPQQVLMVTIEQYVNSSDIGAIMDDVGLSRYAWHDARPLAPNRDPDYVWPTLQELIDTNQRLLIFNDVKATSSLSNNCPAWLYYCFDYHFENHFETNYVTQWRCDIDRGWCTLPDDETYTSSSVLSTSSFASASTLSSLTPSSHMSSAAMTSSQFASYQEAVIKDTTNCSEYPGPWERGSQPYEDEYHENPPIIRTKLSTMNHMITLGYGSPVSASQANLPQSILDTSLNCSSRWNAVINILIFDYWNIADPLQTIKTMNNNLFTYGPQYKYRDRWDLMYLGNAAASTLQYNNTNKP